MELFELHHHVMDLVIKAAASSFSSFVIIFKLDPKDQFNAKKKLDFSSSPSNKNGLSHNKVLRIV